MDFFKKALVVTALTLIVFSGYPTQAAAISRQQLNVEILNDFVLEPTKNEVILEPGETGVRNISVVNRTERTITFTIDIEDIVGSDNPNDQVKLLGEERGPYSLKDFLIPEVREFTIKTGERITIPVTVSLPADAEPRHQRYAGRLGRLYAQGRGAARAADPRRRQGDPQLERALSRRRLRPDQARGYRQGVRTVGTGDQAGQVAEHHFGRHLWIELRRHGPRPQQEQHDDVAGHGKHRRQHAGPVRGIGVVRQRIGRIRCRFEHGRRHQEHAQHAEHHLAHFAGGDGIDPVDQVERGEDRGQGIRGFRPRQDDGKTRHARQCQ